MEYRVDALDRPLEGPRPGEIAVDHVDVQRRQQGGSVRAADEKPRAEAASDELADQLDADEAGATRHQNVLHRGNGPTHRVVDVNAEQHPGMVVPDVGSSRMAWHDLGDLGDATVAARHVAGVSILAVCENGRWWAIEDLCSHAGCAFSDDGEIDGIVAICNCHGSEFDVRTGEPLVMPANEPLRTFPVRVEGGVVQVQV